MSNLFSANFKMTLNGLVLDDLRRRCIRKLEIGENCDGSDTLNFTVSDPTFLFIEDNIFIEEALITLEIYFSDIVEKINFSGYISAIDIKFPDTGMPELAIYCLDGTHLLNREKKNRTWENTTNAEVVKLIAQEHGLSTIIEEGYNFTLEESIAQSNVTDIEFLESLAENETELFMCKVIKGVIHYVKKGILKEPSTTLYYKKYPYGIIDASFQINKETKQEEISVADINTADKSVDSAVANDQVTESQTQGESSVKTSSNPTNTPSKYFNAETREWEDR